MRLGKFSMGEPQERNASQSRAKSGSTTGQAKPSVRALAAHPVFPPIISIWAAILCGGAVLVLPASTISGFANAIGIGFLGGFAKIAFALIAAMLGSGAGLSLAKRVQVSLTSEATDEVEEPETPSSRNETINPAADLGSESLDAPIEELPFGGDSVEQFEEPTAAEFDETLNDDIDEEDAGRGSFRSLLKNPLRRAHDNSQDEPKPLKSLLRTKPERSTEHDEGPIDPLDLSDFDEMLVDEVEDDAWIEPHVTEQAAEPVPAPSSISAPPKDALDKLRQRHPEELSLVEMVERFAGALHERQKAERERQPHSAPARDAALAEALKALSLFTERGFDADGPEAAQLSAPDELNRTERELRAALGKLQNLRGAA